MADETLADLSTPDIARRERETWLTHQRAKLDNEAAQQRYNVGDPELTKATETAQAAEDSWWQYRKEIKARIRAAVASALNLNNADLERYL